MNHIVTTALPTEAAARDALRAAQQIKHQADAALNAAFDAVVKRGDKLLAAAEGELKQSTAALAELERQRREHMAGWAAAGTGAAYAPPAPNGPLGAAALAAARDAAQTATHQYEAAKAVVASLTVTVEKRAADVEKAADAVHRAAVAVVQLDAEEAAERLEQIENEALMLRQQIASYSRCWFSRSGDKGEPAPCSVRLRALLANPPANTRFAEQPPVLVQRMASRWKAFVDALRDDADATLPEAAQMPTSPSPERRETNTPKRWHANA